MTKESCASRIKKALSIRNITQSQLCEKTNIPKSAISQYISGAFEPKQDRVYLIAKALDVSEAWLMGYDVSINRENVGEQPNSLDEQPQDLAFFRLKKGLEAYDIEQEDIDFLLTVMKAHKERNK